MYGSIIMWLIAALVIIVLVLFGIVRLIMHFVRGRSKSKVVDQKNWYLQMSLSREDGLSQLFFLLGLAFLGVTLFSINRNLGAPLTWQSIVLVMVILSLALAYRLKLIYALAAGLITLIIWWVAKVVVWSEAKDTAVMAGVSIAALLFLIMFVLGHLHDFKPLWKRSALVYKLFGVVGVVGLMFIFSTQSGLRLFQQALTGGSFYASWQLSVSLLILVIGLAVAIYQAASKKLLSLNMAAAAGMLGVFFLLLSFFPNKPIWDIPAGYYYSSYGVGSLTQYGAVWVTVFNLFTLLILLGLILSGYRRKESWQINFGAIFLFIFILVKYFDWFFTFLDKSVFFIGAGILLFVVGYFMEKSRRKMVQNLTTAVSI